MKLENLEVDMPIRLSSLSGEKFIAAIIVAIQQGAKLPETTADQRKWVGEFLRQHLHLSSVPVESLVNFTTQMFILHGKNLVTMEKQQEDIVHQAQTIAEMSQELLLMKRHGQQPLKPLDPFEPTDEEVDNWVKRAFPDQTFEDLKMEVLKLVDSALGGGRVK